MNFLNDKNVSTQAFISFSPFYSQGNNFVEWKIFSGHSNKVFNSKKDEKKEKLFSFFSNNSTEKWEKIGWNKIEIQNKCFTCLEN